MRRLSTEIKGRLPLAIVIMDFCTKCTNAVSLSRALCSVMESLFLNYSKRLRCEQRIFSTDREVTTIRHIILGDQTRSKRRDLHSFKNTDSKIKKNLIFSSIQGSDQRETEPGLISKACYLIKGFLIKTFLLSCQLMTKPLKGKIIGNSRNI